MISRSVIGFDYFFLLVQTGLDKLIIIQMNKNTSSPNSAWEQTRRWISTPGFPLTINNVGTLNLQELNKLPENHPNHVSKKPCVPRLSSQSFKQVTGSRSRSNSSKGFQGSQKSVKQEAKEEVKKEVKQHVAQKEKKSKKLKSLSPKVLAKKMPAKALEKVKSEIKFQKKSKIIVEVTKRRESVSPKLILEPIAEKKQPLPKPQTRKPPKIKTKDEGIRQSIVAVSAQKLLTKSSSLDTVKFSKSMNQRSIRELLLKYNGPQTNDSEQKVAEMLKKSPYNQPIQPARTHKKFYTTQQDQSPSLPINQSIDDSASFLEQTKRDASPQYQMYDSNQKSTMSKLRVMEFLENSSSGNNIFKTLKQARSQGGLALGTSISRLTSVNNNSQYQKLLRIQNLESSLEKKRVYPGKLIVPPLALSHHFPSRNDWQQFDTFETEQPHQLNETKKINHLALPNQDATTDRRNSASLAEAAREDEGSNDPTPNKYNTRPQNIILVKRKTKPFRPFDITSNQNTDRQLQSEPSESFSDTLTSPRNTLTNRKDNTDHSPALEVASGEYDPISVAQFQPSRTFVSQGARSLQLDATPEQDSQQEADQEDKSSLTEVFIQEEQKTTQKIGSPLEIKSDEFDDEQIVRLRHATVSMCHIPQDLKEYLNDCQNFEVQPFNEVIVENFDCSKVDKKDTPDELPYLNLKSINSIEEDENQAQSQSYEKEIESVDSFNKFSQSFRIIEESEVEIHSFDPPPIKLQFNDFPKKIDSAFSLENLYSQIRKTTQRENDLSPKAAIKTSGRQIVEKKQSAPKFLSSRNRNLDVDQIAQDLDLSDDFEILLQDEPKQFKNLAFNYTSTKSVKDDLQIETTNVQKHLMKRTPLKHFKALENQKEMEMKRVLNDIQVKDHKYTDSIVEVKPIGEDRESYNYVNLVLETIDPDASDIEDNVELIAYYGHPQTNFTQIGHFILSNLMAMAVLKRIKIRINSAGNLCVEELKSSLVRDPVDQGEVSPTAGRPRKDSPDTSRFTANDDKSSFKRSYYTFKDKKEKNEAHLDNVINALMKAQSPVKGLKEDANNISDEASDYSRIHEDKIPTKFITKIITVKQLWEIDELLTTNTYLRAKKNSKAQNFLVQSALNKAFQQESQLAVKLKAARMQTMGPGQPDKHRKSVRLVEDKVEEEQNSLEIDSLFDAKSQLEMSKYLNDRFPLTQTHQFELKTLNRVSKMQLAFIDITDDIVAQMAKIKQATNFIKREVFQSRSNSNNFSSMSMSTSKFKRPKNKTFGQVNLEGIPEDASQLSEEYDQSSVMVIQDWNQQLRKFERWDKLNSLFQYYLKPFSCDFFLMSQHFQVEATFSHYPERNSRFGFSTSYIQYIQKTMQDKVFQKNYKNVLKLAIAKRTKYLDSYERTSAYFEVNMNKQLLSMLVKQTKQGNVIFNRNGIVKFLSSVFAQDEALVLNCLHNVSGYPKQMIYSLKDIFKRTTEEGHHYFANIYNIKKNLDSLTLDMFRSRSSEFNTTKQIIINNDLVFLNDKKVRDLQYMPLPILEANLQFAQECGNSKLVKAITLKIQSQLSEMKQIKPDETFSTYTNSLERFITFKNQDNKGGKQMAEQIISQILKKSQQRRSTIQVLNSIPKYVRYQKLSCFMLSQDFGYVTQIQSKGNCMVFSPILAKTFFKQGQNDTPADKKSEDKPYSSHRHSFGLGKIGSKESDSPQKGTNEPSPIKEVLCEDDDFGSESSFGKGKQNELIASIEILQNKLEDSKSEAEPLGTMDIKIKEKMQDKIRLKELQKKIILRASTEVTDGYKTSGVNLRLIKKSLDYEVISEKTGESDFGVRESLSHDFIGSEFQMSKHKQSQNENKGSVAINVDEMRSSQGPLETALAINIPIKTLRTDEDSGEEEFQCKEMSQTASLSQDLDSSYEVTHEESDQTPKLPGNVSKKNSKFDEMNLNAIQKFLARTNTIRPYQAQFSRETLDQRSPSPQVHKAEYKDLTYYHSFQEKADNKGINSRNVIKILRPKTYVPKKIKQFEWRSQGFSKANNSQPTNNFFKSKPILPQYQTQQNLKSPEPEVKPADKNKVVQYLIAKNSTIPSSLVKDRAESALIVSLAQVKIDKDRRNHIKVLRAIEMNNLKQVQHFNRSNHQGVDITDKFGNTLLNFAAQYGCLEICELLINSGYKLNTRNCYGNTPLHYAIAFNHQQLADVLIQNGADEDVKNYKKMTPWQGI